MNTKLSLRLAGIASAVVIASAAPALASPVTFTGSVGHIPFGTQIFPTSAPPGVSFTYTPDAAVVSGSVVNQYAAPYVSAAQASWLGQGQTSAGPDTGTYLTSGAEVASHPDAAVTISFTSLQYSLGLIWGSIDKYNTLSLYSGGAGGTLVGSITGGQIDPSASGYTGSTGTYGVDLFSTVGFDTVVFTSTQYAFEFTGVTYSNGSHNPPPDLPEPGSLALLGAGLGLLGFVRYATRRGKAGTQPLLSA